MASSNGLGIARSTGGRAARDAAEKPDLVAHLRRIYLGQETGVLAVEGGSHEELFFRRGELFLDRDSEIAVAMGPVLGRLPNLARPAADPQVTRAMAELASRLHGGRRRPRAVEWRTEIRGVELIGPLPLTTLLLESATVEASDEQLIARLGGEGARLQRSNDTPALAQLTGLDGEMAQAMVMVERPVKLADVLRGNERGRTLRGLARLWAVGLVASQGRKEAESGSIVPARTLHRFLERIAEGLEDQPIDLPPEQHRARLAELMGRQGALDHYSLLGVERGASDTEFSSAYQNLGRLVHPSHAASLGLAGKEGTLELLFERATEAYLTLSDPHRRSAYKNMMGLHQAVAVEEGQRAEEKRSIARQHYLQGASYLAEMEYSTAVDLLKEAARLDPKAEYWATLGKAQAKNPKWRRHAIGSFRNAIELESNNPGFHLALAKVYESSEQLDEAKASYARVLELMPSNVDAQVAMDRLAAGSSPAPGTPKPGGLRGVLGRRKA